jgi:predicted neuraminidase
MYQLIFTAIVFGVFFSQINHSVFPDFAFSHIAQPENSHSKVMYQSQFASHEKTHAVHAAAIVELNNGDMMSFWYGGSREGAKDVQIWNATYQPETQTWSEEKPLISRFDTEKSIQRYIKKLGNPVVTKDASGKIWLFYVSVSIGGWSTSQLNVTTSIDDGQTWSAPSRLITSPFLNLSHLVKNSPVLLADGSIGLPVYFELAGKFSEWLHITQDQKVQQKSRISNFRYAIQPSVVPVSSQQAVVFMRNSSESPRRIYASLTDNSAKSWQPPLALTLNNPNASVVALAIEKQQLIMVFNNHIDERNDLSLAWSKDQGKNWHVIHLFEDGRHIDATKRKVEYSYPALMRTSNGDYHLLYTWHKTHIKHITFNSLWLQQKISSVLAQ